MSKTLIILVGNIGTGKSTFASCYKQKKTKKNYQIINVDSIVNMLGGGVYDFDESKRELYYDILEQTASSLMGVGENIINDNPNLTVEERKGLISQAKYFGYKIKCFDFGKGDDESLNRRLNNDRGIIEGVWKNVHKMFMGKYQKPTSSEDGLGNIRKTNITSIKVETSTDETEFNDGLGNITKINNSG